MKLCHGRVAFDKRKENWDTRFQTLGYKHVYIYIYIYISLPSSCFLPSFFPSLSLFPSHYPYIKITTSSRIASLIPMKRIIIIIVISTFYARGYRSTISGENAVNYHVMTRVMTGRDIIVHSISLTVFISFFRSFFSLSLFFREFVLLLFFFFFLSFKRFVRYLEIEISFSGGGGEITCA